MHMKLTNTVEEEEVRIYISDLVDGDIFILKNDFKKEVYLCLTDSISEITFNEDIYYAFNLATNDLRVFHGDEEVTLPKEVELRYKSR